MKNPSSNKIHHYICNTVREAYQVVSLLGNGWFHQPLQVCNPKALSRSTWRGNHNTMPLQTPPFRPLPSGPSEFNSPFSERERGMKINMERAIGIEIRNSEKIVCVGSTSGDLYTLYW